MCRCQNPFHLPPPSPVTGPPEEAQSSAQDSRHRLVPTLSLCGSSAQGPALQGSPAPASIGAAHGAFGVRALPSPAIRGGCVGTAARSQGCRNAGRAVPGVSPGTALCRRERTGTGFAETAGSGRVRGAGPASPSLTSRDCLRQCHPALGQDSTQQPRARRGHPDPAPVPLVQLCRGSRAAGSFPPFPSFPCRSFPRSCREPAGTPLDVSPCSPQPWGSQNPPRRAPG